MVALAMLCVGHIVQSPDSSGVKGSVEPPESVEVPLLQFDRPREVIELPQNGGKVLPHYHRLFVISPVVPLTAARLSC